jgi:catalase
MTKQSITTAGLALAVAWGAALASTPEDMVNALNGTFGVHPGMRASHAKGTCTAGEFRGTAEAAALTTAAHLQGPPVKVVARFSVGGGNPKASDKSRSVRGLALRFDLPDGKTTDLILITAPVFFVAKPEHFVGFVEARKPDPATGKPDPAKVKAFNDAHPDTKPQIDYLNSAPIPASYAQAPYRGVNAFKFTNAEGKTVYGRWRAEPVAGRAGLTDAQLQSLPDDFLKDELRGRLGQGPVEFDLWVQVAEPGDDVTDPTQQWPATRREVKVGRISLREFTDLACDPIMFNPVALPPGIEPSEDPILQVRLPAYVISVARRAETVGR